MSHAPRCSPAPRCATAATPRQAARSRRSRGDRGAAGDRRRARPTSSSPRRSGRERLQDVPVAVSVITGDALASAGQGQHRGRAISRPDAQLPEIGHDAQPVAVPARRRHLDLLDRGRAVGLDRRRRRRLQPRGRGVQRPRRYRPDRGAARAAGHAVRQERVARASSTSSRSKPGDDLGGYVEGGLFQPHRQRISRPRGRSTCRSSTACAARLTGFYDQLRRQYPQHAPNSTARSTASNIMAAAACVDADVDADVKLDLHRRLSPQQRRLLRRGDRRRAPITAATGVPATTNALDPAVLPTPLRRQHARRSTQNLVTATDETGYGFSLQGDVDAGPQTVHLDHRLPQL